MLHECIIEKQKDVMAYGEQYLVHCQCHMGSEWKTWRPGDPEFVCPTEDQNIESVCEYCGQLCTSSSECVEFAGEEE